MKWKIASTLKMVEGNASQYKNPVDALYELIKNLEDENAKEIFVEFEPSKKRIFIAGNGEAMSLEKVRSMIESIGVSKKSEKNFGVGLVGFLRLGRRMTMLSKGRHQYVVASCFPEGEDLLCDPDPHYLERQEHSQYQELIKKLHRWKHGTVTVIERVGTEAKYYPMGFKFKEGLSKTRTENALLKKVRQRLTRIKYISVYDGKKESLNKMASIKVGKNSINMQLPSVKEPFVNSKGEKRNVFRHNSNSFELQMRLWVEARQESNNELTISFHGQDALKIQEVCKDLYKLRKGSLFKGNDYTKYLDGWIDFEMKSPDDSAFFNVYTQNRDAIRMPEEMADTVAKMLQAVEEPLHEMAAKYVDKAQKSKDKKESERLNRAMHALYLKFPDTFSHAISVKNTDPVLPHGKTKCRSCKLTVVATNGKIMSDPPKQKKEIIHDTTACKYQCLNCGAIWEHRHYTKPIWTEEKKKKPFYDGSLASKERERRRGFGYLFEIEPLMDSQRRYTIMDTKAKVNSIHSDYKRVYAKYKQTHSKKDGAALLRYSIKMAILAIFEDNHDIKADPDAYRESLEDAMACIDVAEAEGLALEEVNPEKDKKHIQNIEHGEKLAKGWKAKIKSQKS